MDLAEAWRAAPLGDADRHEAALTLMATRALRAGRAADALDLIDRRCRISKPGASDLAVRALAARLCGLAVEAEADLAKAEAADPLDPFVAMTRMRLASNEEHALAAARRIAAIPGIAPDSLNHALKRLFTAGARAHAELDVLDDRLTGTVAWSAGPPPRLRLRGPEGETTIALAADPSLPFAGEGVEACLMDVGLAGPVHSYRVLAGDDVLAEGRLWPRAAAPLEPPPGRTPTAIPARAPLAVVIPVFGDFETTRRCLDAVLDEAGEAVRVIVVDDASPDPAIKGMLEELAQAGRIEVLRNPDNLGFAGAVRRGIDRAGGADVLLLNADAILPKGALNRLAGAAYGAPDIGTVTPLSNNGEYTSLPRHAESNPAPSREDAERIDRVAAKVNAGRTVDLPNGTGFCLFVRHDCMAAVGTMPTVYLRGYFEDVEFSLRARRAGFRNVCATSLYVVHHGTRSFGMEKRALVARNLAILRARFPGFQAECAAYAKADPLREARSAIAAEVDFPADRPAEPSALCDTPAPTRPPALGVPMRSPSPEGDAFVAGLSAALRRRAPQARIVVIGCAMDDLALMGRGNVFVTGPPSGDAFAALAARTGVVALAVPAPDAAIPCCPHALMEPGARVRPDPEAIVDWFADRLAATPSEGEPAP